MDVADPPKFTVRYEGKALDARQVDGKLWFAVDGRAVLTRRENLKRENPPPPQFKPERYTQGNVTASLHVVLEVSSPAEGGSPAAEERRDSPAKPTGQASSLLRRAAQASPLFAGVTALPAGTHILCYLPSSEAAERLTWQESCLYLLEEAASDSSVRATLPLPTRLSLPEHRRQAPLKDWALVPCYPSDNSICALARGGSEGDGGRVAWFHSTEEAGETAVADDLLLTSIGRLESASYSSIMARRAGGVGVEVVAEAHRVLAGGILSGYDVGLADNGKPSEEGATTVFVDDSTAPAEAGHGWGGTVTTKELPGGGLHRHVRVKIDASCAGKTCDMSSNRDTQDSTGEYDWCEVLLAQHVPRGAYIDVDEVKARHDFDVRSSLPAERRVGVETFEGEPIDIELPSSVSGQHVVNFNIRVRATKGDRGEREGKKPTIRAEMTLPVHLRYPDPGCERRGEGCEEYAWVEVPPPLASIRCGSVADAGPFHPVLPLSPPVGVGLRVPRGIAWHRDVVMWGTVVTAALGCAYTLYTLVSVMSLCAAREPSKKRR
eukprot:g7332.t1